MWLKLLSSEDRSEAVRLASTLRRIGARVELRECVDWEVAEIFAVKGKLSELKSKGFDVSEWEKRVEILREILRSNVEDLETELFRRIYPELYRKITEDEEALEELMDKIVEIKLLAKDVEFFMTLNNLKLGRDVEVPEDPIVFLKTEDDSGKAVLKVSYFPVFELYVDVLSLLDADLSEIEDVEGLIIAGLLEIAVEILSRVQSEGNVEIQKLQELSCGVVESENFDFAIDCRDAFETILRSMEKRGILRIAGNRVKVREK